MPHTDTGSRRPAAAAIFILLLACIGLTACGGSSSTTSSSANAAATDTSTAGTPSTGSSSTGTTSTGSSATAPGAAGRGPGSARFAALRECLQKNGITQPQRAPGGRPPAGAGGFPAAGGPTLPKGVTRAQYEAALKKCGAGNGFAGRGVAGRGGGRVNSPVFTQALAKYAACLRQNGINVPAPDTSGKGPVFNTKGINTSSPQFRSATTKCRGTLVGAFRHIQRSSGAAGSSPTGAAGTSGSQASG